MKLKQYLNEVKKIKLSSDFIPPIGSKISGYSKGDIVDVIKFDKDNNAIVWSNIKIGGKRTKLSIPSYMYDLNEEKSEMPKGGRQHTVDTEGMK